jgi:A/G-specific adenine glycosylase
MGQMGTCLTEWYGQHKRALPWRDRLNDSYAVWISEVMLQQTTVSAVIGYYNRWMGRFPTLKSLAEAPLDDVLKHWAGLGYYARARNLKKAAEDVICRFGGILPSSVEELMTLPGIGRYTAGAIASISYQMDCPIVDANVSRVLCRVFGMHGDPKTSSALQKQLWSIAEASIPPGNARDYNQALMELGALVCSPSAPACGRCPLSTICVARRTGDPTMFPEFAETKKWLKVVHCASYVQLDNKCLIVQRPLDQLWGGLWELPRVATFADERPEDAAIRAVRETVGIIVNMPQLAATVKHVVTNHKVTLLGYFVEWNGTERPAPISCRRFAWAAADELENYAISSPQVELLEKCSKISGTGQAVLAH